MNCKHICIAVAVSAILSAQPALAQCAVIPLKGHVGHLMSSNRKIEASFDAPFLDHAIERARQAGATTVLLQIDSPAGYAFERNAVCDVINKWRGEMKIVAFVEDARSAAATIALSCDTIIVSPTCRVGVGIALDSRGGNTVSERWLQTEAATIRSYLQQAGRDGSVADALAIEELQLWWHPEFGYSIPTKTSLASSSETVDSRTRSQRQSRGGYELRDRNGRLLARVDGSGSVTAQSRTTTTRERESSAFENEGTLNESAWRKLDGEFSLLTLTSHDMVEIGLAVQTARTVEECLEILEISEPIDISRDIRRLVTQRRTKGRQAHRAFKSFEDQIEDLDAMHARLLNADERALRKERRKLLDAIFAMTKDARKLQRISEREDRSFSISPVELCQLRETSEHLQEAHTHLRELEDADAGSDIAAALDSWEACTTVS
jgi:hypothetical protein